MKSLCIVTLGTMLAAGAAFSQEAAPKGKDVATDKRPPAKIEPFRPGEQTSEGSVTVAGSRIDYQAVAGTLVVHPKGWDDTAKGAEKGSGSEDQQNTNRPDGAPGNQNPTAEAAMFYVAYFKKAAAPEARPVTFLFNGGPGSSTVWLHMGAFRPEAGRHRGQHAFAGGALHDRRQRSEPARRERSRIRGRARHGFQSNLRQRQGKSLLWRRCRRLRLCGIHHWIPIQIQPLELA